MTRQLHRAATAAALSLHRQRACAPAREGPLWGGRRGREEAAWAAASCEGPKPPPLVRASLSLMQIGQSQPGVATDLRTPVYAACFMILLLTKPTSAFKLLTVEVHAWGESVEHRILEEGGQSRNRFPSHENHPSQPLICSERAWGKRWRWFLSVFLFWLWSSKNKRNYVHDLT